MASKLEIRITGAGSTGTITIGGNTFTFKPERLGSFQVKAGATAQETATNFESAFRDDMNRLGVFGISSYGTYTDENGMEILESPHIIIEITHPQGTYFDSSYETTDFAILTITSTPDEIQDKITVGVYEAMEDKCGKFALTIDSTVEGNTVTIEIPIGNPVYEYVSYVGQKRVELARPSIARTGVVKSNSQSEFFAAPGVLSISSVEVSSSPFGAVVTVNSNSGTSYSLDGVNFQGSKEFAGLLAGNYTAYVKDSYGCTKTRTFTVTEGHTQGLSADPYINVPIHNSIRFAQRTGDNFLNYLSTETPGHAKIHRYFQDYLVGDSIRTQFKSSYPVNKVFLIDSEGAETEISVIQKSNNINRVNIYEGNYTVKDGRLAVYFTAGNIYNEDGTPQEEGHLLYGLLPDWYEQGTYLLIEGVGVTQIDKILYDEDGTNYAITLMDGVDTVISKKITSIHIAHPYEVYEFQVYFPTEGLYQLRLEYGEEFYLSEIIKIHEELPEEFLEVQWWNENNNDILYNTGIRHFRRLEWENYFTLIPKSEREKYDTDTSVELVNSKSFSVYKLSFNPMPMEVARGLVYAFDNSSMIVINGVVFLAENPMELEPMGAWYLPSVELVLIDQTMDGQQEIVDVISAEFLNVGTVNNVSFLRLN